MSHFLLRKAGRVIIVPEHIFDSVIKYLMENESSWVEGNHGIHERSLGSTSIAIHPGGFMIDVLVCLFFPRANKLSRLRTSGNQ